MLIIICSVIGAPDRPKKGALLSAAALLDALIIRIIACLGPLTAG